MQDTISIDFRIGTTKIYRMSTYLRMIGLNSWHVFSGGLQNAPLVLINCQIRVNY